MAVIAKRVPVECQPRLWHEIGLTDTGRLVLFAHGRDEIASELALHAMKGTPCGCVNAMLAWRGTLANPELQSRIGSAFYMTAAVADLLTDALRIQKDRRHARMPDGFIHDRMYGPMDDRLMTRIQSSAWDAFRECDYRVLHSATGWEVSTVISEPGTNPLINTTAYDFIIQSEPFVNVHQMPDVHAKASHAPRLVELGLRRSWLREVHRPGRSVVHGFFVLDAVECDVDFGGVPNGFLVRYAVPSRGYQLRVQEGYMVESPCGQFRGMHKKSFEDAERMLRLTMDRRGER